MSSPATPLSALVQAWPEETDPWTPPVFVAASAWRLLVAAGQQPTAAWRCCASDLETAARAAGCAWAWAQAGHSAAVVHAGLAGDLDGPTLTRLRAIGGERLRLSTVAAQTPVALAPTVLPAARHDWPPVALSTVAASGGHCFAARPAQARPLLDALEAVQALAADEAWVLPPAACAQWEPMDALALWAMAQIAGSGWRVIWPGEVDPAVLTASLPAIAAAGLPLVLVCPLDAVALADCAQVDGWWIAEAADRGGLHALLATALLDRSPWLIRVPAVWVSDLPPVDGPWEPGAGRRLEPGLAATRWLVCTAAGLPRARALGAAAVKRGIAVGLLQAASLRPFPWQACSAEPCAVVEEPGSDLLSRCAQAQGLAVYRIDADLEPDAALEAWLQH